MSLGLPEAVAVGVCFFADFVGELRVDAIAFSRRGFLVFVLRTVAQPGLVLAIGGQCQFVIAGAVCAVGVQQPASA